MSQGSPHRWPRRGSHGIDLIHKSHNTSVPYPIINHSEQKCVTTFHFWMVHYGISIQKRKVKKNCNVRRAGLKTGDLGKNFQFYWLRQPVSNFVPGAVYLFIFWPSIEHILTMICPVTELHIYGNPHIFILQRRNAGFLAKSMFSEKKIIKGKNAWCYTFPLDFMVNSTESVLRLASGIKWSRFNCGWGDSGKYIMTCHLSDKPGLQCAYFFLYVWSKLYSTPRNPAPLPHPTKKREREKSILSITGRHPKDFTFSITK